MSNCYYENEPMQFDLNEDIYSKLIRSFETKMLSQCQYDSFYCYMKGHCDVLFTRDITNFLEDYNAVICQAIQAIKSLQAENSQLKEMRMIEEKQFVNNEIKHNNDIDANVNPSVHATMNLHANKNNMPNPLNANDEEIVTNDNIMSYEEIVIKQPLRQQLRRLSKGKQSSSSSNVIHPSNSNQDKDKHNNNANNSSFQGIYNNKAQELNQQEKNQIEYNNELDAIQKTNEILKQIQIIKQNQQYFLLNYFPNHSLKEFLSKIIEYKYDTVILNEILKDINRLSKQEKELPTSSNKQQSSSKNTQVTHHSFSGSLRSYNIHKKQDEGNNQKPFVQFTNPYGRLFKHSD